MQGSLDEARRLAERLADGKPIDWGASTLEDESFLSDLRAVERLADFHRKTWEELLAEEDGGELLEWNQLKVVEKVGQGGFGEVYLAIDPALEREVALKLLHPSKSEDAAQKASVLKEGRLLAKIRHPNVATVYGVAEHEGRLGLWMEFVRGQTLEQLLESQGPLSAREAAGIGIEVCQALAAVHAQGLVHRDVKAQNVMRRQGGRILLMDFGLGEQSGSDGPAQRMGGTPLYMPPEMLRGEPATPPSDIYSLGVLLFYLVTGDFPVIADDFDKLRQQHDSGKLKLLSDVRPNLPNWFVDAVHRALANDPAQRFETAGQMERALSSGLSHSGSTTAVEAEPIKPRSRLAPIALAALALLLIPLFLALNWERFFPPPARDLKPSGVVFADVNNQTGDPEFDSILIDRLRRELESRQLASFEFADEQDIAQTFNTLGITAGSRLDSKRAAQIAAELYRVPVMVELSISRLGDAYGIRVTVMRLPVGAFQATLQSLWANDFPVEKKDLYGSLNDIGDWLVDGPLEDIGLQALFYEALALRDAQRYQQAISKLGQVQAKEPGFTLASVILTSIHLELQQFREGFQHAATAIEKLNSRQLPSVQDSFAKMLLLHDIEDYVGDELHIRGMIEQDGENYDRLFYLGYAMAAQGDFEGAVRVYQRAVDESPQRVGALVQLAKVHLAREDWASVRSLISSLAQLGEDTSYYRLLLEGASAWLQGKLQAADDSFQKLKDTTFPLDKSEAYAAQVYMLAEQGKFARAKEVLAEGILHDSTDEGMLGGSMKEKQLGRAYILFRQGGAAEAEQLLGNCRQATRDGSPHRLLRAGTILARAGLIDDAREYLTRLQEAQLEIPLYRRAIQKLKGEILLAEGKAEEALAEIQAAAADDPAFYYRDYLASALEKAGRLEEAANEYARIIRRPGILWFLSVYEQYPGIYADTLLDAGRLLANRPEHREEAKWALERYLELRGEADGALLAEVQEAQDLIQKLKD